MFLSNHCSCTAAVGRRALTAKLNRSCIATYNQKLLSSESVDSSEELGLFQSAWTKERSQRLAPLQSFRYSLREWDCLCMQHSRCSSQRVLCALSIVGRKDQCPVTKYLDPTTMLHRSGPVHLTLIVIQPSSDQCSNCLHLKHEESGDANYDDLCPGEARHNRE